MKKNNSITKFKEVWMPVNGFDKHYEICNQGYIKSLVTNKILKGWLNNGYPTVQLGKREEKNVFYIHILVAKHFISNPLLLPEVNHLDSNKLNAAFWNLEWSTHADNMNHAKANKLMNGLKGERNHFSKTNNNIVRLIRSSTAHPKLLAFKHNLSISSIYRIKNKKTWKHIA